MLVFSLIRLEMCSTLCHYYTELDCVCMYGTLNPCSDIQTIVKQAPAFEIKDISDADEIVNLTMEYMNTLSVSSRTSSESENDLNIDDDKDPRKLPGEVIQKVTEVEESVSVESCNEEDFDMENGYFDNLPVSVWYAILFFVKNVIFCKIRSKFMIFQYM